MPTCPRCSRTDAREIAPGYYQCESTDSDGDRCRNRYQVGTDAHDHLCQCGTLAVGRCVVCGDWVCGEHSSQQADGRVCKKDLEKRREAERQPEKEVLRAAEDFVSQMARAGNPGAKVFGKSPAYRGWVLACITDQRSSSGHFSWFVLMTNGSFGYAQAHYKTGYTDTWVAPRLRKTGVTRHSLAGLPSFPHQYIYIPKVNEPLELFDAITRRLDAICIEHGLSPVSNPQP